MKTITLSLLVAAGILSAGAAQAADEEALAKSKNCLACHAVDKKLVGPAYKDIAKKYAGQDATAKLSGKIRQGGSGVWGVVPMPANPQVNEAEAKQLASWILTLK